MFDPGRYCTIFLIAPSEVFQIMLAGPFIVPKLGDISGSNSDHMVDHWRVSSWLEHPVTRMTEITEKQLVETRAGGYDNAKTPAAARNRSMKLQSVQNRSTGCEVEFHPPVAGQTRGRTHIFVTKFLGRRRDSA